MLKLPVLSWGPPSGRSKNGRHTMLILRINTVQKRAKNAGLCIAIGQIHPYLYCMLCAFCHFGYILGT